MARPEKVAVVEQVRHDLSTYPATLFTEYRGLTVADLAELRARLREAGARYVVVKNTLARIAAQDAGFDSLDEVFTGPTALTICEDEPVGPAKALRQFARDHPQLAVKGAILDGRVVDAETADRLADLATREELLARFASLMHALLAGTANLLQAPLSKMARLLQALEDEGVQLAVGAGEGEAAAGSPPASPESPEAATLEEQDPSGGENSEGAPSAPAAGSADAPSSEDAGGTPTVDGGEAAAGDEDMPGTVEAVADAAEVVGSTVADAARTAGDAVGAAAEALGSAVSRGVESVAEAVSGDEATDEDANEGSSEHDR
ncbi:MAG TPA: 50S ribosomal protein L10 [Nitriliruptorales bacterium]|nr:50S ribosomal protein L10 [Nitriliruptorales bacterium]